ncbi:hypothetical protein B0J14DRAFT_555581 [Halenospora varia]|nr:hypothetical protein B0J14DRAFT_555581 [Halenospora varia]
MKHFINDLTIATKLSDKIRDLKIALDNFDSSQDYDDMNTTPVEETAISTYSAEDLWRSSEEEPGLNTPSAEDLFAKLQEPFDKDTTAPEGSPTLFSVLPNNHAGAILAKLLEELKACFEFRYFEGYGFDYESNKTYYVPRKIRKVSRSEKEHLSPERNEVAEEDGDLEDDDLKDVDDEFITTLQRFQACEDQEALDFEYFAVGTMLFLQTEDRRRGDGTFMALARKYMIVTTSNYGPVSRMK